MKKKELKLEINSSHTNPEPLKALGILITPPLGSDYWIYRVQLSEKQAILGFKKFSTIGIGFAEEEYDGNCNLPYGCETNEIWNHIKKNKGDKKIQASDCIRAIGMIQAAAIETLKQETIKNLEIPDITDEQRLAYLSRYLRQTNSWQVANTYDRDDRFIKHQ